MQRMYLGPAIIFFAVVALYWGFVNNPIVFDDTYFFTPDAISRFLSSFNPLYPRQLPYWTHAVTWKWIGSGIIAFRVISLLLHASVAIALYFFLRQLQQLIIGQQVSVALLPLLAALVFALHPAAVYGAAYLTQRTTVMATLFALLSWSFLLRGLQSQRQGWLWGSVASYALSVLSKEHAVMVPAVSAVLCVWWWRTQLVKPSASSFWPRVRVYFIACATIVLLLVFSRSYVLGSTYEFGVQNLSADNVPQPAWLLSALSQGLLYFKYLGLWVLPNALWMSADMREPFARSLMAWPQLLGFTCFLVWPLVASRLLWCGGRNGLAGFAMLAPWLLFATEMVTVRYLEPFVLYRSYLWLAPAFAVFIVLDGVVRNRLIVVLAVLIPLLLFPLSLNRLNTFSHSFLLWDDALRLARGKKNISGLERIYVDRGIELIRLKKFDLAIKDFTKAIEINSRFDPAYGSRATALAEMGREMDALPDDDMAISLQPKDPTYRANKAHTLASLGRLREAKENYQAACDLGWQLWCAKAAGIEVK